MNNIRDVYRSNKPFNEKRAGKAFADAVREMKERAFDNEEYKMKDHTANPKGEPGKKKLNSDDKRKLDVIHSVTGNNRFFNAVKVDRKVQPAANIEQAKKVVRKL